MERVYYTNRIYFETSFELPKELQKQDLQELINQATSSQFSIFLSKIDEKNGYIDKEATKKVLEVEDMKGPSIKEIHQNIIDICEEDHESSFRFFFAIDDDENHYMVIHAHHAIADGFMITSFCQFLYHVYQKQEDHSLHFVDFNTIVKEENLNYPDCWDASNIQESVKQCIESIQPSTAFPTKEVSPHYKTMNTSRIIDAEVSKRAFITSHGYGSLHQIKHCVHGLLLWCYLRAIIKEDHLREGSLKIHTITNLRRYLKNQGDVSPNIFISSFPTVYSIQSILSHEENCAVIQKRVNDALEKGLPLSLYLQQKWGNEMKEEKGEKEMELEISNLGIHPEDCFTRSLITQVMYSNHGNNTLSIVVWTDCNKRIHLCGASDECCMKQERLEKILDSFVHEVFECGVI